MKPTQQSKAHLWLFLPFVLMMGAFCIAPSVWVIIDSFYTDDAFTLEHYQKVLTSPFYLQAIRNSFWVSTYASIFGLIIGLLATSSLRYVSGKIRHVIIAFVNVSNNFSGVPLAFAFIIVLGTNGAITLIMRNYGLDGFNLYSTLGLIIVYIYFQIPMAILLLYPAFDSLKDDWQEAAALLGAGPLKYWQKVALPVLLPSILGTFVLLLANALGAYATAYTLTASNVNLIPIRIGALVAGDITLNPNLAAALSIILVVQLALVTLINQWLLRRRKYA